MIAFVGRMMGRRILLLAAKASNTQLERFEEAVYRYQLVPTKVLCCTENIRRQLCCGSMGVRTMGWLAL